MSAQKKQVLWPVEAQLGCGVCPFEHRGVCIPTSDRVPPGNDFNEVPNWCPLRSADIVLTLDTSGLGGES